MIALPLLALLLASQNQAHAANRRPAVAEILGSTLVRPRLTDEKRLVFEATPPYLSSTPQVKKETVRTACQAEPTSTELVVLQPSGGALWQCPDAVLLEDWDDTRVAYTGGELGGRSFMTYAGSYTFKPAAAGGLSFTQGISRYKDRFDLGLTIGLSYAASTLITQFGGVARAGFSISRTLGWNLGVQPLMTVTVADADAQLGFQVNGLVGLNFFVPSGSVDLTATIGSSGTYSLLTGYTLFWSVR